MLLRVLSQGGSILALGLATEVKSAQVTLAWDANTERNVAGYHLKYGTSSGVYTEDVDVGDRTSATVSNLIDGQPYFFVVTAYDTAGLESLPSAEISYPASDSLRNISTRAWIQAGDQVLIGGFLVTGNGQKNVVLRALGPSLPVPNALGDPVLELHSGNGALIATNDNWRTTQQDEIIATGLAPTKDTESALVVTLNAGAYTIVVRSANSAAGVGLVEVYDLDNSRNTTQLMNISSRGYVLTGSNVLIGGFIVGGGDWGATIIVRAIGPSLTALGVSGALPDPLLALYDANGTLVGWNDNWKDTQQSEITATGVAPTNDRESAIVATLPAGNYTAVVAGQGGTTGVGLVELYNLQ